MKENIENDIRNHNLPADKTIQSFFNKGEIISCDDVVEIAYKRYLIGNPPGKNNKYGDAINWECLLKNVPDKSDIYIVSADQDYQSIIDKNTFNPFLDAEWKEKKHGSVKYYTKLTHFLNEHTRDIKLKTEEDKEELICRLRDSRSFSSTHAIIAKLNSYSNWTHQQIEELCNIAKNNDQVGWILEDNDVHDFYTKLIKPSDFSKIDEGSIREIALKIKLIANE